MKKTLKTILLTILFSALAITAITGSVVLGTYISDRIHEKENTFDINTKAWLGLSYELNSDSGNKKKGDTAYTYVSNDKAMKVMDSDTPLQMTDSYTPYQIILKDCFNSESSNASDKFNGSLLKKEVQDKDGKAIAYNQKFDPVFDFIKDYSHEIMTKVDIYDLKTAMLVSYRINVNFGGNDIQVGYFSSTAQNGDMLTLRATKITGIHLFSER